MTAKKTPRALYDLAQLLEVGIAPSEAIARLRTESTRHDSVFALLNRELKAGRTFASAMLASGIASQLESAVLAAAAQSAELSEALRYVAANAEKRETRVASMPVRLWLPNFILVIALVSKAVRTSSAGMPLSELSGIALVTLCIIALSQYLLYRLRHDAGSALAMAWRLGLQRTSDIVIRYFEHYFFSLFAWQVESGLDYLNATNTQSGLIDASTYRRSIQHDRAHLSQGGEVTKGLANAGLARTPELIEVLRTGEASGRIEQALRHYLDRLSAELDQLNERVFTYLPRAYYVLAMLLAAASII